MPLTVLGLIMIASVAAAGVPAGALIPLEKAAVSKPGAPAGSAGKASARLDCSEMIEVTLDAVYSGDNTGLFGNVPQYGCNPWYEPAGEVVYHLYLAQPTMWQAELQSDGCDLDLAVLDQCDENAGCLVVADTGVMTTEPVSGDIYFVVDGVDEWGCPFTLTLTKLPSPDPTTFCDLVETMTGNYFTGTTCGGANLIASLDCGGWPEEGLEAYYEIMMPPGSSFTAHVNSDADAALWLLDGCVAPFGCLAFSDETVWGEPETLSYTNAGTALARVFLVIDSYMADTCGWYELDFRSDSGAVAVQQMSFGHLKALYR